MVTENNSLVNSFITGLDSDSSIDKIKDTSYIEALNIRILSYGNNGLSNLNGVIKPINGVTYVGGIHNNVYRILASGSIRDYGAIVYISNTNDTYKLCVATFKNLISDGEKANIIDPNVIFLSDLIDWPENKELWPQRVSISFRYEDLNNVKMYMATGFNPIVVLNISKTKYDKKLDLDSASSYPKILFNKPCFEKYVSGLLLPGMVRYSYLLYNNYGVSTDISPACLSIPVVNFGDQNKTLITKISGEKQGKKTNCGIQISIHDSGYQEFLDRIKIYRITTLINGLLPTIELIYDSTFDLDSNNDFVFNDCGQDKIDIISIEEYNSMSGVHIIPKSIESKDDMLFAADIKEKQTFLDGDKFKQWDARSFRFNKDGNIVLIDTATNLRSQYTFDTLDDLSKSKKSIDLQAFNEFNDVNKQFYDNQCIYDKDFYYGGTGVNVSWRFVITYTPIDTCDVSSGRKIGTMSNYIELQNVLSTPKCFFINKDSGLVESGLRISTEDGRIQNSWLTKSLRRNELYRYGIILYDKTGNPSPVKWIADIRTPNLYDEYFNTFISHYKDGNETYDLASLPLGLAFNVKNLPDECSGYEIVRCKRGEADIATVSQGVISKPIVQYVNPGTNRTQSNIYFPTGLLTTATVVQGSNFDFLSNPDYCPEEKDSYWYQSLLCYSNIENNTLFLFVSPEVCYQPESMKVLFKNKDYKLDLLRYLYGCSAIDVGNKSISIDNGKDFEDRNNGRFEINSDYAIFVGNYYTKENHRHPIKRYFLKPSISNSACPLEDNDWKFKYVQKLINGESLYSVGKYVTQSYWLKMRIDVARALYYKSLPYFDKFSCIKPGIHYNDNYDVNGEKMNNIDKYVYSYIKLYEQADSVHYRSFDNEKNRNDDGMGLSNNPISIKSSRKELQISDVQIATDLKWNEVVKYTFEEKGTNSFTKDNGRWWPQLEYQNHVDSIGTVQFCNTVFFGMDGILVDKGGKIGDDSYTIARDVMADGDDVDGSIFPLDLAAENIGKIPYASGGRCALILVKDNYNLNTVGFELGSTSLLVNEDNLLKELVCSSDTAYGSRKVYPNSIPGTSLCNLRKSVTPYGGYTINAISASVYYSSGLYFTTTDRWNPVFDGDVYISVLDYTAAHKAVTNWTRSTDTAKSRDIDDYRSPSIMIGYAIPVESSINCRFSYGLEFSDNIGENGCTFIQKEPSNIDGLYSQTDPEYVFNTAYASEDTVRVHSSYDYNNEEDFNKHIDFRCRHSSIKENNEHIDSWTKFLSSNFIDVDSRYGKITDMKSFNELLVFWQELAVGMLSVNQRSVVNDNNDNDIIIGTGGVLARYDYLDTTSGMKQELFCNCASRTSLYWFDSANNEIKALNGLTIVNLSKSCYVHNLLNKYRSKNEAPHILFDSKNNEIICKVLNNDSSISYSDANNMFLSIYTIPFQSSITFNNGVYMLNNDSNRIDIGQWNAYNKYSTGWNNKYLQSYIKYVVNKTPVVTKVFDNQEIVTPQEEIADYFESNHLYTWSTELDLSESNLSDLITNREHNYRYSIPRSGLDSLYGSRIRGKYMICSMQNDKPNTNIAISYIITKFRVSCS